MPPQHFPNPLPDLLQPGLLRTVLQRQERNRHLDVLGMRDADDNRARHGRVLHEALLDFERVDVFAACV